MSLANHFLFKKPLAWIQKSRRWIRQNRRQFPRGLWTAFLTFIFITASGLLKDALKGDDLFTKGLLKTALQSLAHYDAATDRLWVTGILAGLVLFSGAVLYVLLPGRPPLRSLAAPREAKPHRVLIYSVSDAQLTLEAAPNGSLEAMIPKSQRLKLPPEAASQVQMVPDEKGEYWVTTSRPHRFVLAPGLAEGIAQFEGSNIQQFLRAITPHASILERVHLIASPQSSRLLPALEAILRFYCPKLEKTSHTEDLDFDDVDALYREFNSFIETIAEDTGDFDQSDLIIDITGGQKPTSIAGSLSTLHNHVKFQYVQTGRTVGSETPFSVKAYELIIENHRHLRAS